MQLDVLLRNAFVVDGSGRPGRQEDLGILDGRLTAVGDLATAGAHEEIDVAGGVVAPGFIDAHTHSDWIHLADDEEMPGKVAGLLQGVTTEVCGNCGFSPFPLPAEARRRPDAFETFDEYRHALVHHPLANNLAPLVGHSSLRHAAVGDENRPPTADELDLMRRLLDEALAQGAFGLSSGLIYPPGAYASAAELEALAGVVAAHGRLYATHMRNEGDHVVEAVHEALQIGRAGPCAVQISHHKVMRPNNFGRTAETLSLLDEARRSQDVTVDVYPYTASSTGLAALLGPEVSSGGPAALVERLTDTATRRELARRLPAEHWEGVVVSRCSQRPEIEGHHIVELAAQAGVEATTYVCDLLTEGPRVTIINHAMHEDDVQAVLRQPYAMIGSDGGRSGKGKPHPRRAGTFARVLGRYVRDLALLPLEVAVAKMTSMPADRFGLAGRGRLVTGAVADLVVFDPLQVTDRATFEHPLEPPAGVRLVMIAGRVAVRDGVAVDAGLGSVLAAGA